MMPVFMLTTSAPREKITEKLLLDASDLICKLFNVCEKEVLINIKAGVSMSWGCQQGLYALGAIQDTQPVRAEDTKQLAPAVFEFCQKYLDVPQNRMYLGFVTLDPDNVAYDGRLHASVQDSK